MRRIRIRPKTSKAFICGCRVLVKPECSRELGSSGPYTITDIRMSIIKSTTQKRRRPTLGDRLYQLTTEIGQPLPMWFKHKHLEPFVELPDSDSEEETNGLGHASNSLASHELTRSSEAVCQEVRSGGVSARDQLALTVGPHRVTKGQLSIVLNGTGELSDTVVDAYCLSLMKSCTYSCLEKGEVELVSSLSIGCLLEASSLSKIGSSRIERFRPMWDRWSSRRLVLAANLEKIRQAKHWVLLAFSIRDRAFWYLNSLGEKDSTMKSYRRNFQRVELAMTNVKRARNLWAIRTIGHSIQPDSISCGVYVCDFIRQILENDGRISHFINVQLDPARQSIFSTLTSTTNTSALNPTEPAV